MKPIRVILADDHIIVRKGLTALIERFADMHVLGGASNGQELLELLKLQVPDVVIMDISMPVMNGIDTTAALRSEYPSVRILILSMHDTDGYLTKAIRAGCHGYVLKDAAVAELESAISAVARGECYLSPSLLKVLFEQYSQVEMSAGTPLDALTLRQREVLKFVAEGETSAQIAARFKLSLKTIETHRAEIMARLKTHDVATLTRLAIRYGLIRA